MGEPRDGATVTVGTQTDDTEMNDIAEQSDGPTVTVRTQTDHTEINGIEEIKEIEVKPKEQAQQLLPGIPDFVTLEDVTRKLPWSAFHALSSVSRPWLQAIQRRLPYQVRVRSNSTDSLVLHTELSSTGRPEVLALYSMRDKRCYGLPPIPDGRTGHLNSYECVAMDGKIYVIGGDTGGHDEQMSAGVFVYDLVGLRQWRRCASMQDPRQFFGCGVLDGKIYVFGGASPGGGETPLCEMFDPIENVWSPIPPMRKARHSARVVTFGEELCVYKEDWDEEDPPGMSVEVYHSVKKTWTVLKPISAPENLREGEFVRFIMERKLYVVTKDGIDVKSMDSEEVQSFSFPAMTHPDDGSTVIELACEGLHTMHHELLVTGEYFLDGYRSGLYLLQSQGFGSGQEVTWQFVPSCPEGEWRNNVIEL